MSKISILLPTYNRETYLASAIESVIGQTHQNWELLISDNCSQDNTFDIAKEYAKRDKRIICWRNETNIGLILNYNKCIEKASGDYIELFGADDIFDPLCLEKLSNILDNNPNVNVVVCARKLIDDSGNCTAIVRPFNGNKLLSKKEVIFNTLGLLTNWIVSPVMYREKNKGTGLNTTYKSDIEYWIRVLGDGDLLYIDEVLFNYRVHANSETANGITDLSFALSILRSADIFSSYCTDGQTTKEDLRNLIIEKLLHTTNYALTELSINFDKMLAPLDENSKKEYLTGVVAGQELDKLKECLIDMHDYRRIAGLVLTNSLGQLESLKQLGQSKKDKDALYNQIDQMKTEIDRQAQEIKALSESFSWKVTEPLRKLRKKFLGGRPNPNYPHC